MHDLKPNKKKLNTMLKKDIKKDKTFNYVN